MSSDLTSLWAWKRLHLLIIFNKFCIPTCNAPRFQPHCLWKSPWVFFPLPPAGMPRVISHGCSVRTSPFWGLWEKAVICQPLGDGGFSLPLLPVSSVMVPSYCFLTMLPVAVLPCITECSGKKWVGWAPQFCDALVLGIPNGTTWTSSLSRSLPS